jgi:hypothetical protein
MHQCCFRLPFHIVLFAFAPLLSSCATIFSPSHEIVNFYGYNGSLIFFDSAGNRLPSKYLLEEGSHVNVIALNKKKETHFVRFTNQYEQDSCLIKRQMNYAWVVANLFNYEVGLLIDMLTGACYTFSDQYVRFEQRQDTSAVYDQKRPSNEYFVLSGYLGVTLPAPFGLQGPGLIGASLGYRISSLEISVDAHSTGSSIGLEPNGLSHLIATGANLKLQWYLYEGIYLCVAPAWHRLGYYRNGSSFSADEVFYASRNSFSIGLGVGLRLADLLMLEIAPFIPVTSHSLPSGEIRKYGMTQFRAGVSVNISEWAIARFGD